MYCCLTLAAPLSGVIMCVQVPIYTAGDDTNAKQFRSLHAVQRHMVDTNQCKMLYDGNEDEYEDFYDYTAIAETSSQEGAADAESAPAGAGAAHSAESRGLALSTAINGLSLGGGSAAGWELAVPAGEGGAAAAAKVLGSREMAKYYRQKPKPLDMRRSVAANMVVAQYRALGVETLGSKAPPAGEQRAQRERQRQQRQWLNLAMRTNINRNLPKNVPY
jgi:pre-60S factor REI1